MTWELAAALITIITFGISICKIVSNNTKVITELRDSVDQLSDVLQEQKVKEEKLEEKVQHHDTEISVIKSKLSIS